MSRTGLVHPAWFPTDAEVFELEGRFPQVVEELPQAAVDYVADVVKVPGEDLARYDLSSRSAKGHRTQIREALGFRPATRADSG